MFFCTLLPYYIVGYQGIDVVGGGITWAVATLPSVGVTLENQTLGSFALPTDQAFSSGDSIVLEIYNQSGEQEGAYSFVDAANCDSYGLTTPGWYPLAAMQEWTATDDDLSNDVVVKWGKGVIITSGEATATLTFAGEVLRNPPSIKLVGGGITWTGNATPVNLTLGDLALPTDQGFSSGDSIVLELWNAAGSLEGAYSFVDATNCETYGLTNPGWYPLSAMQEWTATDDDLSNDVPVASGKMVIITSGEADTTLTLPSPLVD